MFRALPSPHAAEAVLRRHPYVRDVAVVQVADRRGHQAMAAVVQLAVPLGNAPAELARYCGRHLPAAQVPADWVITDDAPSPPEPARSRPPCIPRQAPRAPHLDL